MTFLRPHVMVLGFALVCSYVPYVSAADEATAKPSDVPRSAGHGEVFGAIDVAVASSQYTSTELGSTTNITGSLAARAFFRGVREDHGPRTWLPFLQRTSSVTVRGSTGGFWAEPVRNFARPYTGTRASVGVDVDAYVLPELAVFGGFAYAQASQSNLAVPRHFGWAQAGLGLRIGDNRINASYTHQLVVLGGELQPTRLGVLTLDDQVLLDDQLALSGFVSVLDSGAEAGGSVTYYLTEGIGIYTGGAGGRAAFLATNANTAYTAYRGFGGVAFWLGRFVRIEPNYTLSVSTDGPYTTVQHAGSLGLLVRIP